MEFTTTLRLDGKTATGIRVPGEAELADALRADPAASGRFAAPVRQQPAAAGPVRNRSTHRQTRTRRIQHVLDELRTS